MTAPEWLASLGMAGWSRGEVTRGMPRELGDRVWVRLVKRCEALGWLLDETGDCVAVASAPGALQ